MVPSLTLLSGLGLPSGTGVIETTTPSEPEKEAGLRKSAQEFEAAFIGQMLTFSGLDKALMSGGGEDVSAFTSFYIESFSEQIAEKGGFGLAESFYDRLSKIDQLENSQKNLKETGTS